MSAFFYGIFGKANVPQNGELLDTRYNDVLQVVAPRYYRIRIFLALQLYRVKLFAARLYVLSTFRDAPLYKLARLLLPLRGLSAFDYVSSGWQQLFRGFSSPTHNLSLAYRVYSLSRTHQAYLRLCYNLNMALQSYICYIVSYRHYTAIRRIAPSQ